MFTRATGFVIVPLWLAAMSWLVAHDVWPGLTAQDPPLLQATEWLKTEGVRAQFAIHNEHGRLGTIWTEYFIDRDSIQRWDTIWIEQFPVAIAPLRISADSIFTADGALDELTVRLENTETDIRLHGERFHKDFSFNFESGPFDKSFKIPLAEGRIISGGGVNPFASLTNLTVGQRWRMQVFNPIAALTGLGDRFIPILVEVTGEEKIFSAGEEVNCLVVESAHARAWVDENGAVQIQEMTLPLVGKIRILREPTYDNKARLTVKRMRLRKPQGRRS